MPGVVVQKRKGKKRSGHKQGTDAAQGGVVEVILWSEPGNQEKSGAKAGRLCLNPAPERDHRKSRSSNRVREENHRKGSEGAARTLTRRRNLRPGSQILEKKPGKKN